jgi:formylglycine-generating enzyme required for sulfatase activity
VRQVANTPLSAAQERALKPGDAFQECANCPVMKVLPAGSFTMGSPASEPGRRIYESPQHQVMIEQPFAIGKFDVTRDQFSAFVNDAGYDAGSSCYVLSGNDWILRNGQSWSDPGFAQTGSDPVACIEWRVAQAYVDWLHKTTGKAYRLLSESEWEYAARAGTTTVYYWGNSVGINNADCTGCGSEWGGRTAPAGSFPANPFGLYDMTGNVFQWVADCWNTSYRDAPADGSPWTSGDCTLRVVRGGSWLSPPRYFRSAYRNGVPSGNRAYDLGFRVARTLLAR